MELAWLVVAPCAAVVVAIAADELSLKRAYTRRIAAMQIPQRSDEHINSYPVA